MNINKLKTILPKVQKPARYIGGERLSVLKDFDKTPVNFAFCFPDSYEIGMSHLGLKVIYEQLNSTDFIWCQRVFMPLPDMVEQLQHADIKLFSLEGKQALCEFDVVGFTLQYELSYTNILAMLKLGGIPLWASERTEQHPIVIAGGPCACNVEPLADLLDAVVLGEGEDVTVEVCRVLQQGKGEGVSKQQLLRRLADIDGVYVPSLYKPRYGADGEFLGVEALDGAPLPVRKASVVNFAETTPPTNFVVPLIGTIHDRAQIEILRGCVRGCRFCQAGFIYRPFRERSPEQLCKAAKTLCDNTGYDEIALTSLSSSDHTEIEQLLSGLIDWTKDENINMSLPSLRVDNFSESLAHKLATVRKSGLTFAPEAGTQRLRDAINKNVTEEELKRTVTAAFNNGYTAVKLYFMMGLPTETDEDIIGIAELAGRVVDWFYQNPNKQKGKGVTVSVSVSCYVPKPHTPFQRVAQDTEQELRRKQKLLLSSVKTKKVSVSYHDAQVSRLEAVFARGDRTLTPALVSAFEDGCVFDGWSEYFDYDKWCAAFERHGISQDYFACRERAREEVLPWEHLHYGVDREFLESEYDKAVATQTSQPCNLQCYNCGVRKNYGGVHSVCNKGKV